MRRRWLIFGGIFVVLVGGWAAVRGNAATDGFEIKSAPIARGPLRMTVETTGSISPLISVNVGCEVSGTVGELNGDFNSIVKKGQILARLRPELFEADLAQAKANVSSAVARRREAEVELQRAKRQVGRLTGLRERSHAAADEEVRTAEENAMACEARLAEADAAIKQAEAARDLNQTKLDRSVIYAPIDGIVLSRLVDVGQTVAAALTTPVLFVLAPDLDQMQLHANVSESDIGLVRPGQTATFTVDAFADQTFSGRVSQVRNNPTTIQNVVTYTVVIDVRNSDRLLKPGMTANVTVEVANRTDALKVQNAALRFRPPITPEQLSSLTTHLTWPSASETAPASSPVPGAKPAPRPAFNGPRTQSLIWSFDNGEWKPIPVLVGITDNRETEVISGIPEGRSCVIGIKRSKTGFNLKEALRLASPENRSL